MFKHIPSRATRLILLMVLVLGLTVGCQKQRANYSLEKAKKSLAEAIELQAEKYEADKLAATRSSVDAAQNNYNSGAFEVALENSTTARELAKVLLAETKAKRAHDLKEQSQKHVRVATENEGGTINPELFKSIVDNDALAATNLAKQKYDKVIALCTQVQTDTDILLSNLKMDSEEKLRRAKGLREELVNREFGRDEAPQYVTDTEAKIAQMENEISYEQRLYKRATRETFPEIESLVKTGIHEARRSRSKKKIVVLEQKLLRARFEGAETYQAELLAACDSDFADINKNFFSENFIYVLDKADTLEPTLDNLILQTRTLAAEDAIRKVVEAIATLEADKARQYVPQGIEKMDRLLNDAREAFNKDLFDEVKKIATVALDEKAIVIKDFDNLAGNELRTAKGALEQSESLLNQMRHIFSNQAPKGSDNRRNSFEDTKNALKTELEELAKDSAILIGVGEVQRQGQKFSGSIESSRQVVRNANWITHEVFHVVAHNNVMEVANKAQMLGNNGGGLAPEEMGKLNTELESAREMIKSIEDQGRIDREGEINPDAYKPSVSQTSVSKASLDVAFQRVKHVVNEKIKAAEANISLAESNKADTYDLGGITSAKQIVQEAKDNLLEERLHGASQKADSASKLALDSNLKSSRGWAAELIEDASQNIEMARQAGAFVYSPLLFRSAEDKVATSKGIFGNAAQMVEGLDASKAYLQSKDIALDARQNAEEARLEPATRAQQEIVRAKHFNAIEYDFDQLLRSVVLARKAAQALEQKDYDAYLLHADEAAAVARAAALRSQNKNLGERYTRAKANLNETSSEGGIFFTVEDVYKLSKSLKEIRKNYSVKDYESLLEDINRLELGISKTSEKVPVVFEGMIKRMNEKVDHLVALNATDFAPVEIAESRKRLRWAEIDYAKAEYSNSYNNLKSAMDMIEGVEIKTREMAFADNVILTFTELDESKDSIKPLLKLSPDTLQFSIGAISRSSTNAVPRRILLAGVDFLKARRDMDNLYTKVLNMEYPTTMKGQYQRLVESVRLARESSFEFEKFLILDNFDFHSAGAIMEQAYKYMGESREIQVALAQEFENRGLQGRLAKFNRIVGE